MPEFEPHLEILPASQQKLWHELTAVPKEFVLYGGTALALHLGHRESVDFDFYGTSFNPESTFKALSYFDDGDLHTLPEEVKSRLVIAAREVDLERLPNLDRTFDLRDVDTGLDL
jgi:hypothetical protein